MILKKPPVARRTEGRKRNERGGKKSKRNNQTALRRQTEPASAHNLSVALSCERTLSRWMGRPFACSSVLSRQSAVGGKRGSVVTDLPLAVPGYAARTRVKETP